MAMVHLQGKLNEGLSGPVEALLDGASNETWPAIRVLLLRETESAILGLSSALSGFDMDEQTKDKMLASLENYARGVVEAKAREEAGRVLIRMKDRLQLLHYLKFFYFPFLFLDYKKSGSTALDCIKWGWILLHAGLRHCLAMILTQCHVSGLGKKIFVQSPKLLVLLYDSLCYQLLDLQLFVTFVSVNLITFFFQSLKLLSVMAAIRLDDYTDNIENTLSAALVDNVKSAVTNRSITTVDPLASSTWEEVTIFI